MFEDRTNDNHIELEAANHYTVCSQITYTQINKDANLDYVKTGMIFAVWLCKKMSENFIKGLISGLRSERPHLFEESKKCPTCGK